MLGRKREDQTTRGGGGGGARGSGASKKRKWQEELSDDASGEEKVTPAEMEAWRAKMREEEQQEKERERQERERQRERELQEERERKAREERRARELEKAELEESAASPEPSPSLPAEAAAAHAADAPPAAARAEQQSSAAAASLGAGRHPDLMSHLQEDEKRQLLLQHLMQAIPQSTPEYSGLTCNEETRARSPSQPCAAAGFGFLMGGAPPLLSSEPVTIQFQVPMHRVKDVLGVKGKNVKAIKQQSSVQKIGIMDGAGSDPATVEIIGMPASVEMARQMVLGIVAGDHSVIGNVVEAMDIEQHLVSKLIGPKGSVISNIKDQSGAYLAVREQGAGMPPKVVMTGPPDCVARARHLVEHFLAEQRAALAAAPPGAEAPWWPELGGEQAAAPPGVPAGLHPARPPLRPALQQGGVWRPAMQGGAWFPPAGAPAQMPQLPAQFAGGSYPAWPPQLATGVAGAQPPWG